jgi:hypothetical protein
LIGHNTGQSTTGIAMTLRFEHDRTYVVYIHMIRISDRHRGSCHKELLKVIASNKHRADTITLETEFGSEWLARIQAITRRYAVALDTFTAAERDLDRAETR